MMYFLIYRSRAAGDPDEQALKLLLAQSRSRNADLGITGMLLFFDKQFVQLLEGKEEHVQQVYASILLDERHQEIRILKEGHAEERLFPDWSMSFVPVSKDDIANEPAYKDIYQPGSPGARDLVSLFKLLRGKPGAAGTL